MTCCVLGLLILSVVSRFRRAVGAGPAAPTLFAPVAARPAPGQLPLPPAVPCPAAGGAAVFGYAAAALALCLAAVPVLVWAGLLENTASPAVWLLRGVCYLAMIAVAVLLSRTVPAFRAARGAGWALVVLGAVIFETGVLDMHVFGAIEVDHGNLLGDMVFHNIGPMVALVGGLVLLYGAAGRRRTSSRSSRSTVTSARPSSSAVTVSSTPPMTT